jgi:hypothetical protein
MVRPPISRTSKPAEFSRPARSSRNAETSEHRPANGDVGENPEAGLHARLVREAVQNEDRYSELNTDGPVRCTEVPALELPEASVSQSKGVPRTTAARPSRSRIAYTIILPGPDSMTERERELLETRAVWPVRVEFDSAEDLLAVLGRSRSPRLPAMAGAHEVLCAAAQIACERRQVLGQLREALGARNTDRALALAAQLVGLADEVPSATG